MTGTAAFAKSIKNYLGISDWCLSYCDGCKWAMYMAFQFEVLHFENLGRDLPGEWLSADLAIPLSADARAKLRQEYKRKMDEDNVRVKKQRQATKLSRGSQEKQSAEKDQIPSFDYGQLVVNDTIKVDLFKEIVKEFRTPQKDQVQPSDTISCNEKLKGYMHVSTCLDYPEEARIKARTKLMEMLDLV